MKKILLLIPLALLLAGCLQLEQTIALKKDGSAIVTMIYAIPEKYLPPMTAAHQAIATWQQQDKETNWFMNQQAVKDFFNRPEYGVSLLVYKQYNKDSHVYTEIVVHAKHAQKACEQGFFGQVSMDQHSLTVQTPKDLDDMPAKQIHELRKLCGNMTLALEVITPQTITRTNGLKRAENKAFWKLSADGRGMDVFGKLDDLKVTW